MQMVRNLLIAIISQAPAVALISHFWPAVQSNLLLSSTLLFGWELFIGIAAFLRNVWKTELEKDAHRVMVAGIRVTVSSLVSNIRNFSPGFRRAYRKHLIREYGLFNDRGLGLINANRLDLRKVFVELRVLGGGNPNVNQSDLIRPTNSRSSHSIWWFLRGFAKDGICLAIIGPPGCGKTTLLFHILLTYAENRQWRQLMHSKVPLILFLREHASRIALEEPPSLPELAQEVVTKQLSRVSNLKVPLGWFEKLLSRGKCVVLLDGLDEVADEKARWKVSGWVDIQAERYHRCQFILSARPRGYLATPLDRAHVLEVQPFSPTQVQHFIYRWYWANEIVSSGGKDNDDIRIRARIEAKNLLDALAKSQAVNDLTVNPLLLTMIAMVHRYHGALPGSRVQLYSEICQVLLERWRSAKGVQDPLRGDQKLLVLKPVAAYMMENHLKEISEEAVSYLISPLLKQVGLAEKDHNLFLRHLQDSSGLFLERERGRWGFAHLTFQEYLTAADWLKDGSVPTSWDTMVQTPWWHETLRLYSAQGDASGIIKACLAFADTNTLALMLDCLDEAQGMLPELRAEGERRLLEALDSNDEASWLLACKARLVRRLNRNFSAINDTLQIDGSPILNCEFHLFLRDTGSPQSRFENSELHRSSGAPGRAPFIGISALEAIRFCKWLNHSYSGGIWNYRLPPCTISTHFSNPETLRIGFWIESEFKNSQRLNGPDQEIKDRILRLFTTGLVHPFDRQPVPPKPNHLPIEDRLTAISRSRQRILLLSRSLTLWRALPKIFMSAQSSVTTLIAFGIVFVAALVVAIYHVSLIETMYIGMCLGAVLFLSHLLDQARDWRRPVADACHLDCERELVWMINRAFNSSLDRKRSLQRHWSKPIFEDWICRDSVLEIAREFDIEMAESTLEMSIIIPAIESLEETLKTEEDNYRRRRLLIVILLLRIWASANPTAEIVATNRYLAFVWKITWASLAERRRRFLWSGIVDQNISRDAEQLAAAEYWQKELEMLQMQGKAPLFGSLVLARERFDCDGGDAFEYLPG